MAALWGGGRRTRLGAGGHRACGFEALEQRTLLSVGPDFVEPLRVGVWTPEQIADLPTWVRAQDWPDWMEGDIWVEGDPLTEMEPLQVEELIHMPLWVDPRGGFRTILQIDGITGVTPDEALSDLGQLGFVDFGTLKSESQFRYTARMQELIDGMTFGGSDAPVYLPGEQPVTSRGPVEMLIAIWSEQRITDVVGLVDGKQWPSALGQVDGESAELLMSTRLLSDGRAGYRTVIRMPVWGDITSLEEADFVDFAVLDAERQFRFSPDLSLDRVTTGGSTEPVYLALAESTTVLSMDDFRDDVRFPGYDGSGYAVAILDTGIDLDHPFFGADADQNGMADRIVYQYDFADGDADASDQDGHGTHVASIAASEDDTYTGMAPATDVIALKVFTDQGSGQWGYVESALQWVRDNYLEYNIVSVNMSLSDGGNYQSAQTLYDVADEIEWLADAGVVVVSASGNEFYTYNSAQGVGYPAADPNSLSVGAVYDDDIGYAAYASGAVAYTTDADRIAPFSQRDDELTTVMAPGAAITAAGLGGGTATYHGTSQAAPHVAGIAAVAQHLADQELGQRLTQEQFASLLQSTGTTVNDGDDEDDNVDNTDLDFPRVDMLALGEAILDLKWEIDANDDPAPGDQADDGNADTFEISRVGDSIQVKVNGSIVGQRTLDNVVRVTINGSTDDDTITVNSLGDFQGNVLLLAGGGTDNVAHIYDTAGDDTFTATPTLSTFQMENAYRVEAEEFRFVHARADGGAGGADVAHIYDSPNDDLFVGRADTAYILYDQGAVWGVRAWSFEYVHGYAHIYSGDADTATLKDSAADDELVGDTTKTYMWYSRDPAHLVRAKFFPVVTAFSNHGGTDTATLTGSNGYDDVLTADPERATLASNGVTFDVYGFESALAYGGTGTDTANLTGSAGDDLFDAEPGLAEMKDAATQSAYLTAQGFEAVTAAGGGGDGDYTDIEDSSGDDTFTADPTYGELAGPGYSIRAENFAYLHAYARNGGQDQAHLRDSAGDDEFKARPGNDDGFLQGSGFFVRAKFFEYVHGYADGGGNDIAELYDSTGDDLLKSRPNDNIAFIQTPDYFFRAKFFDEVYGKFGKGGADTVYLDGTSGDDHLFADGTEARVEAAIAFWTYVQALDDGDEVYASGRGGNDTKEVLNPIYYLDDSARG